ncbi:MAG: hypothetical protein ACI4XM_03895 [Candidatus Coprovivens sp.]
MNLEELINIINNEGLERYTKIHFGSIQMSENCLSIMKHSENDFEICYVGERGKIGFHEVHLSEEKMFEKCIARLRDNKIVGEYMERLDAKKTQ